jgi:tetratricopeptide (TPR) repeat protein
MIAFTLRLVAVAAVCSVAVAATDLDREIVLTPLTGTEPEDVEISRWQERAQQPDARADVFGRLVCAFIAKARRTLDAGFYTLAQKTLDVSDASFGASADSRLLRGHVLHNLHRFRDAEAVARQLVAERGLPMDLALLSDALIEQGKLTEGIAALQRMLNLKPGTEAFSRIAHVRWLKGDLAGAIAAMELALESSDPRDSETRAWLLTRLSGLALQGGDAAMALTSATRAIDRLVDYAPALLAQGRALVALNCVKEALPVLERAESLVPLPEYQWWLADVLGLLGRREEASNVEQRLRTRGAENDPRTLALFLATRGESLPEAIKLARAELKERQDVFSHDALAWGLATAGNLDAANAEMRLALAEHTEDARLHLHAGEIALARGDAAGATGHFAASNRMAATLTPSERARLARRVRPPTDVAANEFSPNPNSHPHP